MANEELRRRARRVKIYWAVAGFVVLAAIVYTLLPRPAEADLVRIDRGDVRLEIVDEARTRMHDVYVVSAPVAGRVLRVDVEAGDDVVAGTTLARMAQAAAGFLDTRSDLQARAAVAAAQAHLDASRADLVLAEREHRRTLQLAEAKLVAEAATDQSRARFEAAQAARAAAEAELQRARSAVLAPERVARGLVQVRSPATGRVLRVPQESEAVITAGTPLVEVGDPTFIEVVAEFLSQDAVRMTPGAPARIENWGGPPLAASVYRVEPVARTKVSALGVEEQRTNVILHFADRQAASQLGHDFRVDARVVIETAPDALRAPLGALFRQGEGWAVYRVVDGRARLTPVETGIADGTWRVITGGLAEGDSVVNFPAGTLVDGARVVAREST
jgi:HlyD family secretion protein